MKTTVDLHPSQARIIRGLTFTKEANFAKLNSENLPTDHFAFHLRALLTAKLVTKTKRGIYELTTQGKEFANRLDTGNLAYERQAKVGVLICCTRKKGKRTEYLIQKRLKQPYFGYYGFFGGKIRLGEMAKETALRELEEETGLSGELQPIGIKHKMDYSESGELLEDKFFYVYRIDNPTGELRTVFEGGENYWLTEEEIGKLDRLFDGVFETIAWSKSKELEYVERKYQVKEF